jgi:hypothetical protein
MDNIYQKCPAVMADGGRHFTDYKTPTQRNEYIRHINGIKRDDEYRMFLQKNGLRMLNNIWNFHKTTQECKVNPCIHTYPTRMNPENFAKERKAYDALAANNFKGTSCKDLKDFRLTK